VVVRVDNIALVLLAVRAAVVLMHLLLEVLELRVRVMLAEHRHQIVWVTAVVAQVR
jgi:hypothetical protein